MKVKEIKQISYEIYKLIKYTEDVEIKKLYVMPLV